MKNIKLFALFFTLTFTFASIYSQGYNNEINKYWIGSGLGVTSKINNDMYVAMNLSMNYVQNNTHYKLSLLGASEFEIFGQSEGTVTFGGLIGKHYSSKFTQISFLGGLGINFSEELTSNKIGTTGSGWFSSNIYETNTTTSISIPLEIEFIFKPIRFYGIGISLFADINSNKPFVGILLKGGLGKFR